MLKALDLKAVEFAKQFKNSEAAILDVLMELQRIDGFRKLDFKGVFDYCQKRLELSESQCFYYQRVARKAETVPALKTAIDEGRINLSDARRIESVVTVENCDEWVGKAAELPQRLLEKEIKKINPNARVKDRIRSLGENLNELKVGVEDETEAMLRRVQELESQRTGKAASLKDATHAMAKAYLEKYDPIKKAERVVSSGKRKSPPASPKKSARFIPAHVRHEVNLRDRGKCTEERCNETRWIDIHHILEVAKGGRSTVENLKTLCRYHHRRHHGRPGRSPFI